MPEIFSLYAIFNLDNKSYAQLKKRVQSKLEASTDVLFWTDFPAPWLLFCKGSVGLLLWSVVVEALLRSQSFHQTLKECTFLQSFGLSTACTRFFRLEGRKIEDTRFAR